MVKRKQADLVVDVLVESGVERVYGVAGDSLNGITDRSKDTLLRGTHHDLIANTRFLRSTLFRSLARKSPRGYSRKNSLQT
jgi:hypothetical protein